MKKEKEKGKEKRKIKRKEVNFDLQFFASKKGAGSTKNGRDSIAKRLGMKKSDGSYVHAGNILYRQRGTKFLAGMNVQRGHDDTLFALIDGWVKYESQNKKKKRIAVYQERK